MAQVSVKLQLERYPMDCDTVLNIPIDEYICMESRQPIDFPSIDADPFVAAICCTRKETADMVIRNRRDLADEITRVVREFVMEQLGSRDTTMGYRNKR